MEEMLREVGAEFGLGPGFASAQAYGSGHIHETFVADYAGAPRPRRYLLQRLNTRIFRDPAALGANLRRITEHLRAKLVARGVGDPERRCLRVIDTPAGEAIHRDARGGTWRAFAFIEGTRSADVVESADQAHEAARAFGAFAIDLADLPGPSLAVTIPGFHDLPARVEQLRRAVRADPCGRAGAVATEVSGALRATERLAQALIDAGAADLPRRVMHNDCKLNNLLLDTKSGESLCVIDLDTVMDGTVLCDFGQLVRTAASRAAEDETDLASVHFEHGLFEALAAGYLAGTSGALTAAERRALPLAGPAITLEDAVRFLTDHIAGDVYFRVHREQHNLDRARVQLCLAGQMLDDLGALRRSVARLAGS